jgi:hydroxyacyl-ACP dehydratase HTD2-like protein with hotdog domain
MTMADEITLDDLRVPARATAVLDEAHVARIAATLDADPPTAGDALPSLWHWAFFTPTTPTLGLGADGHPRLASPAMAPFPRRMWGAGRLEWDDDLRVGGSAERVSRVRSARTTTGASGTLLLVGLDHEYHQDGRRCIREEQTLVYRDPPADRVPLPADAEDETEPAGWSTQRVPEPTLLFRFSAITFNTHRIHYDLPYARDVEGYPGLVVQGPLTAMTVAGFVERWSGRPLRAYEFKATAPMFAGLRSTIAVGPPADDGTGTAQVVRNDGATAMEASGRLSTD